MHGMKGRKECSTGFGTFVSPSRADQFTVTVATRVALP